MKSLSPTSVPLHLKPNDECIQTVARRLRADLERRFLSDDLVETDNLMERQLELLNDFLSSTDFAVLRADRPELAGTTDIVATVHRDERGKVFVQA